MACSNPLACAQGMGEVRLKDTPPAAAAAAVATEFSFRSAGAGGERDVVTFEDNMGFGVNPWALVNVSLAAMLSAAGDAIAAFLIEAAGDVWLLVGHDTMDPSAGTTAGGGRVIKCAMDGGRVYADGSFARMSTHDWGYAVSPGEIVRVRYVHATRMVSALWRGHEHELRALPPTWDVAHYRFGIEVGGMKVRGVVHQGGTVRVIIDPSGVRQRTFCVPQHTKLAWSAFGAPVCSVCCAHVCVPDCSRMTFLSNGLAPFRRA